MLIAMMAGAGTLLAGITTFVRYALPMLSDRVNARGVRLVEARAFVDQEAVPGNATRAPGQAKRTRSRM